jgi:signal transduction histidine kinase
VFANLIGNAIKYTPEGGRVDVELIQRDGWLAIAVRDTGMGIAPDEIKKIFDEFYRSRQVILQKIPGTGLGLSIAKQIVEAHRGYLEVESVVQQGSVFRAWFPIAEAVPTAAPAKAENS